VDLVQFLADSEVVNVYAEGLPDHDRYSSDNLAITLKLRNASVATITYVANGDKAMGKERIEAFAGGGCAVLDDFRSLELIFGGKRKVERARLRQLKGHLEECRAFAEALKSGISPISFESICATTLATFAIQKSLALRMPVEISAPTFLEKTALSDSQKSMFSSRTAQLSSSASNGD
jgi:polar amino acid transport system substrate-binding protein